ncbi:MAG: C4-dicarboxylate transporter DcuC [Myxococcota bacterium]|nr:C4-dicarboxylate transporter DcuC [Myxococcota bacterium]
MVTGASSQAPVGGKLLSRLGRIDVRLVLGMAAALLFLLAGQPLRFVAVFASEMVNDKTVVPICSAMGFAHVLQATGCDRHLVHLLLRPLRHAGPLLLPAAVGVGFLVNTAMVSQTSTAATIGVVLVPLLRGAGYAQTIAGAALLLGSSVGGEQLNPGAVEIVTLAALTGQSATEVVRRVLPMNLLSAATALVAFTILALRRDRSEPEVADCAPALPRVSLVQAAVPVVPLVLLLAAPPAALGPAGASGGTRIAAAMLVGVLAAGLASPRTLGQLAAAFFAGAGYAYTHVISLIVVATALTEGLKLHGFIEALARGLGGRPLILLSAAILLPCSLAALTGSGIAPAVAVMKVLVPMADQAGMDPTRLGALVSISAQLGRTMSPAAAVVMMSASLSGAPPWVLLRHVAPPLLLSAAVLLAASAVGLI